VAAGGAVLSVVNVVLSRAGAGSRGADALLGVIEQLAGYPVPASAVESKKATTKKK